MVKQSSSLLHGLKGYVISRFIIFLGRGVDSGKDADRVIAFCKDTGFRDMVTFLVNIFSGGAFRTIADDTESLKMITIGFDDIAVIDVNYRFIRNPFFNGLKIGSCRQPRNATVEMFRKGINNIYFFGIFGKLIRNIRQQAAVGDKHTVGRVSGKFPFWFRKTFGIYLRKLKFSISFVKYLMYN